MKRLIIPVLLAAAAAAGWAEVRVTHAISMHGEPKYSADFEHFDYVNPDAPQGGTLHMHSIGTYDNFNRYAQRGVSAIASTSLYDTLMTRSEDETNVLYPLIAEKLEYPEDFGWVIFHLNPDAHHQDGVPITSADVVFSFNTFMEKGVPHFRQYFKDVEKAEALDRQRVKFTLSRGSKEMIMSLADNTVLPKHYWKERDFSEPLTEVPLGSGAYTISDYKIGQYVVYKRLDDYWARNLPVNRGKLNFDFIRYDYYRDQNVAFEAFKAGEYDIHRENISKNWATLYSGPNFDEGYIIKEEISHEIPQPMQAFIFNTQRSFFSDHRVRAALNYALGLDTWWIDSRKLRKLPAKVR